MKNLFLRRYLSEKISLQKMAGSLSRLSSVLAKSTIDLNPHQIHAALYAFNSPLSRGAILADEVGLGKTIEAGIIIAQLWAEGKRKILIITPASLRTQWQDELLTKFGLESEVWDGHPTHKSSEVVKKVRSYKGRLRVYLLPGYSPELNPGEGVWREVKSHRLGRAGVFTFADMKSKVLSALRHLAHRPDKIRSLFRTPSTLYAA